MLAFMGNVLFGLAIAGAIVGGGVLFWIARQDGSIQGRTLGVLIPVAAILTAGYLTFFHRWL
jgi:hypothetical protein